MKRRDAIKNTALLMGYAVSASAIAGLMSGCEADTKTSVDMWKSKTMSDTQLNTLREASERILPATEGMVGAKDVLVERFVDEMLDGAYKPAEIDSFKKGLDDLEAAAQTAHNNAFSKLQPSEMDALITKVGEEAMSIEGEDNEVEPFFYALKGITLLGFFTSEKVGEDVLNYLPIPGGYWGDVPMSEIPQEGRIWSF
ncbi:MAG: gluconate 2-dehydrogenase subunit 3 family protein [Saprospiraceae bacterium]|nr:gluconate 2-dehydrogenase subunit 3 family protein [Saprospiraceae bacterium]